MSDTGQRSIPFERTTRYSPPTGLARLLKLYRLRWKRRRFLLRAFRKRRQLEAISDRTSNLGREDILIFSTVRNEMARLPFFLSYYRNLGVTHFLIVDNDSTDGTGEYLADQPDVSLWGTTHSYRLSRFGVDWLAVLQFRHGHRRWCLTVDADELLVYPDCETVDLKGLTRALDAKGQPALGTVMLDMFPKGPLADQIVPPDENPIETLCWFDPSGYRTQIHPWLENEWIQGGPRDRIFFAKEPKRAPTLNKFPLVKWDRRFTYVNSTHQMLPIRLHESFDPVGGGSMSGALLHTKFLPNIGENSREELERKQHFQNSGLYQDYYHALMDNPDIWVKTAEKYRNSHQLVELGLISIGE